MKRIKDIEARVKRICDIIECRFCGIELHGPYVVMQHANHAHTVNACAKCAKTASRRGYRIAEKRGKR